MKPVLQAQSIFASPGASAHCRAKLQGPRPNARGFTILEVLVSIIILGAAIIILIQLFSADLKAVAASEKFFSAAVSAESRLKEIAADDGLAENSWTETDASGRRIMVAVREVLKERTGPLRLKMLEINLKIYWVSGGREKAIALKTFRAVKRPDSELARDESLGLTGGE
jgi:type II secretory pathway pseudopilin PulG